MTASNEDRARIAVVMLTVNQLENTARSLQSFQAVKAPDFNIVLWDNGSDDGTADYIAENFPDIVVGRSPTNLGAAAGRNAGAALAIEKFDPEFLLFIDNDTVVTDTFLAALMAPFDEDKSLGQTSAKIKVLKDPERLDVVGGARIQFWRGQTTAVGYGELDEGQFDTPHRCVASTGCTIVRRSVFEKISGFDTAFDPYGYEDLDLSLRVYRESYYALYVPDAVIYHDATQTFESGKFTQKYAQHKARNWFLFMRRHASLWQQMGFYAIGAPLIAIRMLRRKDDAGYFEKLRGFLRGLRDSKADPKS